MTFPHWVTTADGYLRWLEGVIDGSGAVVPHNYVLAEEAEAFEKLEGGYSHTVIVDEHQLVFPGTGTLLFRIILEEHLNVDEEPVDVQQAEYGYHFRTDRQTMVWRYDKHEGHRDIGLCHRHRISRWGREVREPSHEVDLEDVISIIYRDHVS